jgi:hypothetical protein
MTRRPAPLSIALASAALLSGGCSYLTRTPPPRTMTSPTECSTGPGSVAWDVVLALETGSVAVLGLAAAAIKAGAGGSSEVVPSWDPHSRERDSAEGWLLFGLVSTAATVAFVQSARYGSRMSSECREAQARLMFPPSFAPPRYAPQWYPSPPGYPPQAAPPGYPPPAPTPIPPPAETVPPRP